MKIPDIPNNVYSTLGESLCSPLSSFSLAKNSHYLYYFNKEFGNLRYDSSLYQNTQDNSEKFLSHLLDVSSFVGRYSSLSDKIVEIGCGKGGFFRLLSQQGFLNLSGFDAAYEGNDRRIRKRYFSDEDSGFGADVIIMRHTLEHIPSPFEFLKNIISINSNPNASIFIEVPCFDWIVGNQAWWDLTYEHCNYFTEDSFKNAFPSCVVEKVFEEQYLLVKVDVSDFVKSDCLSLSDTVEDGDIESLFSFFQSEDVSIRNLSFCDESISHGRYWVWGCATKGVLLLFHMRQSFPDYIPPIGCIDINPAKQSKYLPSLGYKVMNPEYLYQNIQDGDTVIVSNPAYFKEIELMISSHVSNDFNLVCM